MSMMHRIIWLVLSYLYASSLTSNKHVTLAFRCSGSVQILRQRTISEIQPSWGLYMAARGVSNNSKSKSTTTSAGTGVKGMGMGSGANTKGNKKAEKSSPFNVNASLSRLEKKYDELTKANAKVIRKKDDDEENDNESKESVSSSSSDEIDDDNAIVTTEYVIAVRADGYIDDWVPIAQFCLARPSIMASNSDGVTDPLLQAAVSYYCRELSHVATIGSRIFQSVPRNLMQYSIETLDSFHKHVYETTIQGKNEDASNMNTMTKEDARIELELVNGDGDDKSAIKRAYRTLSFAYHPDRFVGTDRTEVEVAQAHEKYLRIQLAYDTLNSGIRNEGKSWYQSLGGKARTDFVGPIQLLPIDSGKSILEASNVESAISGMSPSIVQGFVARCSQQ